MLIQMGQVFGQSGQCDSCPMFSGASLCACPPYPAGSFSRIMLDAPCSALGQRPCLRNNTSAAEVRSFPALQKQLFETVSVPLQRSKKFVVEVYKESQLKTTHLSVLEL